MATESKSPPPAASAPAGAESAADPGNGQVEALRAELAAAPHYPPPWAAPPPERSGDAMREDEHAWILTYLDMLTLVLVLFVVLLAYTRPDEDQALRWVEGFGIELGHPHRQSVVPPLFDEAPATYPGEQPLAEPLAREEAPAAESALEQALARQGGLEGVEVFTTPGQVELRIKEGILFASGSAELRSDGRALLSSLMPVLEAAEGQITVEGHTDNVPIFTPIFPSNWELSAARASGVVRQLIGLGLAPERLQAVGFADTRPVAGNDTAEGRAENRRVSLVIQTGVR
ncbi:OmpA/MotB family protein [Thioalkalivibrio sulfidiphilus]|uniref:OmpA/MotB family protein n=1 Tax=Thioalkalivibrio sulfidiphilus TaxID=1033854 RepID=UPI003B300386